MWIDLSDPGSLSLATGDAQIISCFTWRHGGLTEAAESFWHLSVIFHTCSHPFFSQKRWRNVGIWMPEACHWQLSFRFTGFTGKPLALRGTKRRECYVLPFTLDEGRRTFWMCELAAASCPLLTFKEPEHVFIGINKGTFTCRRDAALLNLWMKYEDTPPETSLPIACRHVQATPSEWRTQ